MVSNLGIGKVKQSVCCVSGISHIADIRIYGKFAMLKGTRAGLA